MRTEVIERVLVSAHKTKRNDPSWRSGLNCKLTVFLSSNPLTIAVKFRFSLYCFHYFFSECILCLP